MLVIKLNTHGPFSGVKKSFAEVFSNNEESEEIETTPGTLFCLWYVK